MSRDVTTNAATAVTTSALLLSGALVAAFVIGMTAYASWGGPLVDRMSEEIGEVVALRATDLAAAGLTDEAIATYQTALARQFEDEPAQRIYAMQRLGRLLLDANRAEEAAQLMKQAYALNPDYGPTYSMLFEALQAANRPEQALELAIDAYQRATARNDNSVRKWAKYGEGVILRDGGKIEAALTAFSDSHAIEPSKETALQIGLLQYRLGDFSAAEKSLHDVLSYGDATFAQQAREVLKSIAERGAR